MPEFTILNHVIDFMESTGTTYKLVTLSIDQEFVDEINSDNQTDYTLKEIEKAADKCLAHEWIEHASLGSKYGCLRLTPKGVWAARSKIKADGLKLSRSRMKKVSDYIEEHKGIFMVFGFLLALATLGLKILGE